MLRGTKGADFEGSARICRGFETRCAFFRGGREWKERFLLIKGPFYFVFADENGQSPKYAVGLQYMKPDVKHPNSKGHTLVLLQTNLGDTQYEICFQSEEVAKQFGAVVVEQSLAAETEEVRKRLGHENLLNQRKSLHYAETIALKKIEEQPDKPVSTEEIMTNMPVAPVGY